MSVDNTLTEAVKLGRRAGLVALRDNLAAHLADPGTNAAIAAQVAGQLRQTLKELDELPEGEGMSARERFAQRVAAAERPASSA